MNMISVDTQRLQEIPLSIHNLWSCPVTIILAIYFLWQEIGVSILTGILFLVLLIPLNGMVSSKIKKLQNIQMQIKDIRMKTIYNILSGIKIIKFHAWEKLFEEKIHQFRNEECQVLQGAAYYQAFSGVSWFCYPFLVTFLTFLTYLLSNPKNNLTPNKAFVSLSFFNILIFPFSMLPESIIKGIYAYVSLRRINKFLLRDELSADNETFPPQNEDRALVVNGTFSWTSQAYPVLTKINFEIGEGSLVAVVGPVGSGKTALANAIIGELFKCSGEMLRKGTIAYVPQEAWCLNISIQDNILFNKPMDKNKYKNVIEGCALVEDFRSLPSYDQTTIGAHGINLSGGQKQRISLARAVYQDSSIYLLDDPLSAVDSHVGQHIFDRVIGPHGLLGNKTRILITHGLTHLPKMDKIFMMKDGQIIECGTFDELLNANGLFADWNRGLVKENENSSDENGEGGENEIKMNSKLETVGLLASDANVSEHRNLPRKTNVRKSSGKKLAKDSEFRKIVEEESVEIGTLKSGVFMIYAKSVTYPFVILVLFTYILYVCSIVASNLLLSYWSEREKILQNITEILNERSFYLTIFGSLGGCQILFTLIQLLGLAYGTVNASRALHNLLLRGILRAPVTFFDMTPIGRILNRFGKDIDTTDTSIRFYLGFWLNILSTVIISIIVNSIASPYFIIILVPLLMVYIVIQRIYSSTSRQLIRLDSVKKSLIYSYIEESMTGVSSIRAYEASNEFIEKCDKLIDENQTVWYLYILSMQWLQIILETIGNFIILMASILAVVTRSTIGAGLTGLSISISLIITSALNYSVRIFSELECQYVAVERIKEYAEIPSEAAWDSDANDPGQNWPTQGKIEFVNYSVRYRPGLDLVLKNINCIINPGEKVGIVGRTGVGKSSLAAALFRLLEPAEGSILIDGVDIFKLGLHNLRSKLTIITQDPVLFPGTLRTNLDPFNQHSDDELWALIEMTYLTSFVSKSPDGLDYPIVSNGENISCGQKQLVCLARALLKRSKIIVLDEATAAVDLETDELIQNSIRNQFKDCTVLTVAHRINTIMDYDRVMVLDQGQIQELDSPQNLLANSRSLFHILVKDSGLL